MKGSLCGTSTALRSQTTKRIDETMRYVHVASAHRRDLPECVQLAAQGIGDPDRRVLAMLGARGSYVAAAADERKEVRESA